MPTPIFQNSQFDALRNAIYHTARAKFLDRWNRWLNFTVIVLGAAAVGKIASSHSVPDDWVQFAIVLCATVQLVFDFGGRACAHISLQKRYYDLLAEIEISPDSESQEARKRNSSTLLTLAGDEPMPMRALDALAYNTALDAIVDDPIKLKASRLKLGWWQRNLAQWIAYKGSQFLPEPPTSTPTVQGQ